MKGIHTIICLLFCYGLLLNAALAENIYKVQYIKQGQVLELKEKPARDSKTLVAIPHDASWILRRDTGRTVVDKVVWRNIQWHTQRGWVSNYYLTVDPIATAQREKHQLCLKDPSIKDKSCCAYNPSTPIKSIPIVMVKDIAVGESLILWSTVGKFKGDNLVAIPHNARWIADLGGRKTRPDGSKWVQVRWNSKVGWLNQAYLAEDLATTQWGNKKRQQCANSHVKLSNSS